MQSEKESSTQAVALMPSFFSSLPTWKPGVPRSTMSAVMPFSPLRGIGVHVHDGSVGHAAVGDPSFRAVDDVRIVFALGASAATPRRSSPLAAR